MRVAIVGTGISGLVAARELAPVVELEIFEAGAHVGGHTHTHTIEHAGLRHAIDTGFIVFNERTYPEFTRLLRELGVAWQASDMSFSVRDERSGREWNGRNLDTVYAQRSNLLRPGFHRMVLDILRFNRAARTLLEQDGPELELGEWLAQQGFGRAFREQYLVPMAASVWSAAPGGIARFPARFLARFFANHGFLEVDDRPQWLVVRGGSRSYVEALVRPYAQRIRLNTPVLRVERDERGVELVLGGGERRRFDHVVFATHSDQALELLARPTRSEREVLGAIAYQQNEAVLHTDTRLLPRRRKCWASWNYHVPDEEQRAARPDRVALTYWMNRLQGLEGPETFCVTLNRSDAVDPQRVLRRITYHHPCFTREALAAQARWGEINGAHHSSFCGAYWGFGFHEDGVKSGQRASRALLRLCAPLEVAS
ncbi:MAG: FAD-dependent oxidoreductase [Planctomycetes bacterium]|nr:FAD-dependent oxidoreductase [Planctomycetota bacterium]